MTVRERAEAACRETKHHCPYRSRVTKQLVCDGCEVITDAIEAAVAEEREACAELVESRIEERESDGYAWDEMEKIALAIRARGKEPLP